MSSGSVPIVLASIVALSGCASIIGERTQTLRFSSNPEGATVELTNKDGVKIFRGATPVTTTVPKSRGYFKGETYRVAIAKEGYKAQEHVMDSGISGWYLGNVIFGGLIGLLVVDPLTGAMWSFDEGITTILDKEDPSKADGGPNSSETKKE